MQSQQSCVLVLEDDPDLMALVRELLEEERYRVVHVETVDELLRSASVYSPCVALVDSTNPKGYDLWHIGHELQDVGVPPIAFTAHSAARTEFEKDARGFVGVVGKPFDADEFLHVVNSICWDSKHAAAS